MTRREADAYAAETAGLDRRIRQAREAQATLAAVSTLDAERAWQAVLTAWRHTLCDELLTIKSPIRDKETMGRSTNLKLSIRVIDFGLRIIIEDTGYALTTLRLGDLMRAAGYEVRRRPGLQLRRAATLVRHSQGHRAPHRGRRTPTRPRAGPT